MTAENVNAILLLRTRFSDTSLIVAWFSREHGKLKTIAKGALRPKSIFAGKLDLFFQCELNISWSRRSDLHTLREAVVVDSFAGIRERYINTVAAAYFAELIEESTEPEHPEAAIYELLVRGFSYLQAKPATVRAVYFFEHELAKTLGLESSQSNQGAEHLLHSLQRTTTSRRKLLVLLQK